MNALNLKSADEPTTFKLTELTLDPALLLRPLDESTAQEYAEVLKSKRELPPIAVMRIAGSDGADSVTVIVDGQHRFRAHSLAKRDRVMCIVLEGTTRADALLASASANAEHGKPRSPEHKAAAVLALRAEPFYADKSVRWVAEACRVSPSFASKILATVHENSSEEPRATMGKDGKVRRAPKKAKGKPKPSKLDVAVKKLKAIIAKIPPDKRAEFADLCLSLLTAPKAPSE